VWAAAKRSARKVARAGLEAEREQAAAMEQVQEQEQWRPGGGLRNPQS
jgi:hypothetical protein